MAEQSQIFKEIQEIKNELYRQSMRNKHMEDLLSSEVKQTKKKLQDFIESTEMNIIKLNTFVQSEINFLDDKLMGRLNNISIEINRILEEEISSINQKIERIKIVNRDVIG